MEVLTTEFESDTTIDTNIYTNIKLKTGLELEPEPEPEVETETYNQQSIIENPIKKKKGRKSKNKDKTKTEKIDGIIDKFPKLSEKIYDLVKINTDEYFYDNDFNLLLNPNVEPIGFKHLNKFVFYSEIIDCQNQIDKDNKEIKIIKEKFSNTTK